MSSTPCCSARSPAAEFAVWFAPSEFSAPDGPPGSVVVVSPCVVVDVFDSVSSARPRTGCLVLGTGCLVLGNPFVFGPVASVFVGAMWSRSTVVEAGFVLASVLGRGSLPSVSVESPAVSAKDALSADGSSESWVSVRRTRNVSFSGVVPSSGPDPVDDRSDRVDNAGDHCDRNLGKAPDDAHA